MASIIRQQLETTQKHFTRACEQINVLSERIQAMSARIAATPAEDLQIETVYTVDYLRNQRLAALVGVRDMYLEYARQKALLISMLQKRALQLFERMHVRMTSGRDEEKSYGLSYADDMEMSDIETDDFK